MTPTGKNGPITRNNTSSSSVPALVSPMGGGTTINAAWQTLGIRRAFEPPPAHRLRWYITAPPKHGKTTFVSSFPDTLILDFENGACCVRNPQAHRIWVDTWERFESVLAQLQADAAGKRAFKTVVFDTGDKFVQLIRQQLSKVVGKDITEYGQEGSGWGKINAEFAARVSSVYEWGYGWLVIGHIKEEKVKKGDDVIFVERAALNPGIIAFLYRECEVLGSIRRTTEKIPAFKKVKLPDGKEVQVKDPANEKTVDRYWLRTGQSPVNRAVTGQRIALPSGAIELTPTGSYEVFAREYAAACAADAQGS